LRTILYKTKKADRPATLCDSGLSATIKQLLNKEKQMQNTSTITGTIKNIKTFTNERGTLLTGWLDQRDVSRTSDGTADRAIYVVGMNIIALDDTVISEILGEAKAGTELTKPITVTGRLVTKFDRRPNLKDSERRAPYAQLEVHAVEA
jgi:hypothetical protein